MLNFFVFLISAPVPLATIYFPFPMYEITVLAVLLLLGLWRLRTYYQNKDSAEEKLALMLETYLLQKKS